MLSCLCGAYKMKLQECNPQPHIGNVWIFPLLCMKLMVFHAHHVLVFLVGEVKGWQDGLELVENLVVLGHVRGQDTSAGNTGGKEPRLWRDPEPRRQHAAHAKKSRSTASLDDSFPDAFVLICRQVSEDVVLWLQKKETFLATLQLEGLQATTPVMHLEPPKEPRCSANKCLRCLYDHPASPSLVSQRPRRSGGSPVGRCHCIGARVQSER